MNNDRIDFIKQKYSCIDYARSVLGLNVSGPGDRCVSFRSDASNPTSFVCFLDWWYDFGSGKGGDVIDLCAEARHNGDIGAAIRELAGEFYTGNTQWKEFTDDMERKVAYWQSQLREKDREYLHQRRINDRTIEELRIGYSSNMDRLMIPYTRNRKVVYWIGRDCSGKHKNAPGSRDKVAKYHKAQINGNKYEGLIENIPWGLDTLAPFVCSDTQTPFGAFNKNDVLVIAEGMFDIMSFYQEGYHCLSPISGFFNKKFMPMIRDICRRFKTVFMCFDNDYSGNKFTLQMGEFLMQNRIKFVCGRLPKGIKDISEYYGNANGCLDHLVAQAENGLAVLARSIQSQEEFKEFMSQAARFSDRADLLMFCKQATQFDTDFVKIVKSESLKGPSESKIVEEVTAHYTIKYVPDIGFYHYNSGVWVRADDNLIRKFVKDILGTYATAARMSSVASHLKAECFSEQDFNTFNVFNFPNGILDLDSLELKPHDPAYLSTIQLNYDYDPKAECPYWIKFVDQIMSGDELKKKLLQEMAAYVLFPNCKLNKAFFLIGDGGNGKSVLIDILEAVFDSRNCSAVEISNLGKPFEAITLKDALVNFSSETKTNFKDSEAMFKKITSGDEVHDSYKGQDAVNFRTRCKIIASCNNYITSTELTFAFLRRLMFIKFNENFTRNPDLNLTDKLKKELPGIFNWILEGYRRLRLNMAFTVTNEHAEVLDDFLNAINPVAAFYEERLINCCDTTISSTDLYTNYQSWAKEAGFAPANRIKFTRTLRHVLAQKRPNVTTVRIHGIDYFRFPLMMPNE